MVKNRKHNVNGKKNREEQSEWIKPGKPLFPLFRLFFPGFIYSGCASLVLFIQVVLAWFYLFRLCFPGFIYSGCVVLTMEIQSEW
jgi:hypothetical protein